VGKAGHLVELLGVLEGAIFRAIRTADGAGIVDVFCRERAVRLCGYADP
jgi:predicted transcriptional regulator